MDGIQGTRQMKKKSSGKRTATGAKRYGVRRCSAALGRAPRRIKQSAAAAAHSKKWPVEGMAELIADSVCCEVSQFLRVKMPEDRYVRWLSAKAEKCFQGNADFRKKMNGAKCREWLHAFMRHWLSSLLKCERPDLQKMLPPRFSVGESLPNRSDAATTDRYAVAPKKQMRWQPERVLARSQWAWLQAA